MMQAISGRQMAARVALISATEVDLLLDRAFGYFAARSRAST
jgi:hypothetical protein